MTGKELRELGDSMGLSQSQLGSLVGYTPQTISHMEGSRKPITEALEKSLLAHFRIWQVKKVLDSGLS
jgi:transcriptional regulator with XRE-family HTH domain